MRFVPLRENTLSLNNSKCRIVGITINEWPYLEYTYEPYEEPKEKPVIQKIGLITKKELYDATNNEIKATVTPRMKLSTLEKNFDDFYDVFHFLVNHVISRASIGNHDDNR